MDESRSGGDWSRAFHEWATQQPRDVLIQELAVYKEAELWRRRNQGIEDTAEVTMGNKSVKVTGVATAIFLACLLGVAFTGYAMWTHTNQTSREHGVIAEGTALLACIVSMDPQERAAFRTNYSPQRVRLQCPWIEGVSR